MPIGTVEAPSPGGADSPAASERSLGVSSRFGTALTFFGLFSLVLLLQFLSGAFSSEFAGYPDEPAHYVSGLMVRDYIASGMSTPPLAYATDYYERYPKLALGHWPPVSYLIHAGWTLVFGSSRVSILVLMAIITTVLAVVLTWRVRVLFGWPAGLLAGCLFIALPAVQHQTAMVMADILVAMFAFAAAVCFGKYLDTEKWRDSLWFAVFAILCILTKGNGWALMLVPPFALLLTRKLRLLLKPSLWASALFVAFVCVPWQLFAARFARHVWATETGDLAYLESNAGHILSLFSRVAGIPFFLLGVLGMVVTCLLPALKKRPLSGQWAAMFSLFLAVLVFNAAVPLAVETRKLLMAVPPMLMLIAAGCVFLSDRLIRFGPIVRMLPVLLPLLAFLVQDFKIPKKQALGFIDAADAAFAESAASSTYLVSGTAAGEGAFIAEIAMRDRGHRHFVLRGSKALAKSDWNGSDYQALFSKTEDIRRYLNRRSVSIVVIEDTPALRNVQHHVLLTRMLDQYRDDWLLIAPASGYAQPRGRVKVFRRADVNPQLPASLRRGPEIQEEAL